MMLNVNDKGVHVNNINFEHLNKIRGLFSNLREIMKYQPTMLKRMAALFLVFRSILNYPTLNAIIALFQISFSVLNGFVGDNFPYLTMIFSLRVLNSLGTTYLLLEYFYLTGAITEITSYFSAIREKNKDNPLYEEVQNILLNK